MKPGTRAWFCGALGGLAAGILVMHRFSASPAAAKAEPAGNPHELYQLAGNQIAAFRRDDFPSAYNYAARGIREKFPLPQFEEMVRQTYPHLTHSGRLNFGEAQFAATIRASAMIYVSNGQQSLPMIYAFVKENGQWKIEGVQMLQGGAKIFPGGEPRT